MYNDRLVPATDLYFIAENLYHKNDIIQNALADDEQLLKSVSRIDKHNRKIDSVVNKFELTLLVKQEKKFLEDLKKALKTQREIERKILGLSVDNAKETYKVIGRSTSAQTLNKLSALIKIQSKVGDELIKDSKIFVSGTKIYSTFQGILAVIIGIMIVSIISASNIVKIQNDRFNLN